jgi:hypothetical protein
MKKRNKRDQKKKSKGNKAYRVRNWSAYNASLVQRGSLTIWISEDVLDNWQPPVGEERRRGGQVRYSELAIRSVLMLKAVLKLPYRQMEGLMQSILDQMGTGLTAPDYSTLCKRAIDLEIDLPTTPPGEGGRHLVLDSTGLKVYGEGEWKVRQHGYSKRRTWRKLHLSIDEATQEVQAVILSEASLDDAEAGQDLLKASSDPIRQVSADGSYDKAKFYDACAQQQVQHVTVPPRRNARIWQHGNSSLPPLPRDQNLRCIRRMGRKRWKQVSGYHRRSLAETTMFRFKTLFGDHLSSRTLDRQITEARLKCAALNIMTRLGLPDSYPLV